MRWNGVGEDLESGRILEGRTGFCSWAGFHRRGKRVGQDMQFGTLLWVRLVGRTGFGVGQNFRGAGSEVDRISELDRIL